MDGTDEQKMKGRKGTNENSNGEAKEANGTWKMAKNTDTLFSN